MKVMKFAVGLAAGYVLGSRAGREKYERILAGARKAQTHPAVTQAQQKAKELLNAGTDTLPARADTQPSDAETTVPIGTTGPRTPRHRTKSTPAAPSMTTDPPVQT
jgi:hypothetical protein